MCVVVVVLFWLFLFLFVVVFVVVCLFLFFFFFSRAGGGQYRGSFGEGSRFSVSDPLRPIAHDRREATRCGDDEHQVIVCIFYKLDASYEEADVSRST